MGCCRCESFLKWSALLVVVLALFISGVHLWIREKSYVFSAEDVAAVATKAWEETKGRGHDVTFALVESELRRKYPSHLIPSSQTEWIFINCGGWMGAMKLLHASLTEYVLFFGTAIDTSGHSGRYWANISDTMISGTYRQWQEGTTEAVMYHPGDTIVHAKGEATALQWSSGTWMVEYGRGFVPSTLVFALADNIFGTTDYYLLYRTIRIYLIALVQEFFQGNF